MNTGLCRAIMCTLLLGANALGQTLQAVSETSVGAARPLGISKTIMASEVATDFELPIVCDSSENIFLKNTVDGVSSIHELDAAGGRVAAFTASTCPNIKVQVAGPFTLGPEHRLYQIIVPDQDRKKWVMVFNGDGTCRSTIKLDAPFFLIPSQIVTFPSGTMLVAGLRNSGDREVKAMWPYTGLFAASGELLKSIELEGDTELHIRGAKGDPKMTSAGNPYGNRAVSRGVMLLAADGNAYLMRRTSPASIYAISEGGVVVRQFTVDPGDADLLPSAMHITGSRIAILFHNIRTNQTLLKLVDLEGKGIADYAEPANNGRPTLGMAFACYSSQPTRFTFLSTSDDNRVGFRIAEPR